MGLEPGYEFSILYVEIFRPTQSPGSPEEVAVVVSSIDSGPLASSVLAELQAGTVAGRVHRIRTRWPALLGRSTSPQT
jgi:hypothetical protein